jgi:hypothetical protein
MAENPCLAGPFLYCGSENRQAHFSLAIRFSFAYNANHGCPLTDEAGGIISEKV